MPKPTIQQLRAKFALECVESVVGHAKKQNFLIELRHLPAQLHWGGLGQAAASLLADPENVPRLKIYDWLEEWLRKSAIYPRKPSLIQSITGSHGNEGLQDQYVTATREARALAVWLKKFAEAFLRDKKPSEDVDGAPAAPQPR